MTAGMFRQPEGPRCIYLLDDDPDICRLVSSTLREFGFETVECHTAAELRRLLLVRVPDLCIVDLGLPDAQGLQSLQVLQARAPWARHVVLSAQDQPALVVRAIEAGAAGFVPKTADLRQMQGALQRVLDGGIYLPPGVGLSAGLPDAGPELTPRQREVLGLLVDGHPNKTICRQLGLSSSTVKTHLEAIFRQLGVNSRAQAVMAAARLGLYLPIAAAPTH